MSRWLSRLGQLCARRAKTVLALWLAALFAAAGAAAAFSEGTTASYSIPDADYETVLEDLGDEIETFQGGSAVVLLSTQDGQDFTAEQRSGVASLTEEVEQVDVVLEAPDPFSQQEEMEQSREDLEEGLQDLEEGQQEIDEGQEELDEGYEELELLIAQLGEQDPVVVETEAELSTAQEELDQSQQELDESQGDLERAERQVELTEDMNTVSPQSGAALLTLQLSEEAYDLGPEQQEAIISAVEANLPDGVEADFALELVQDVTSIVGTSEIIGLAVAALVLLITLGTVVAAGLPVALALIGVGVGVAGVFALSSVVELTDTDPILALMLGLSLGIDYTLLLIYRHRGQLARGMGVRESIGLATGTAGSAIFFAGVTNVIALAALVVTGIPFLTVMGLAASATIVVVVAAVLLLGPAVLGLLGHRILPKRLRPAAVGGPSDDDFGATALTPEQNTPVRYERLSAHAQDRLMDRGWGRVITRHPWAAILLPLILLVTVALPAADLRLGLPDGGSEPQDSTAYATYDTVRDAFGAGENGPVLAVAELPEGLSETEQEEAGLDLAEEFAAMEGVARAVPAEANDAGDLRLLQIVPETGPNDEETSDLVTSLFGAQQALEQDHGLSSLGFTGQTVANIEIAERLQDAIPLYVGIVVVLCLVLLMAIFRSVAAPVLAAVGYVLSLAASLGAVTAIYQWGWLSEIFGVNEPGPILAFLPILICGVLFGLAIDYQLFIMSGVREAHARGSGARQAILRGLRQGGPVVLACGIIMVSVFAGFVFADLTIIRPIGFGLAFGVLVEALLVRATLIPAATYLLGEKAWWLPPWMDRLIPDVDVEGRRLEKQAQLGSPQEERSERDVQDSFRKSVEVDVC